MSQSNASEMLKRIEVEALLGTDITILDGGFSEVARGTTRLTKDLPDGVYTVSLSAGERARQWVVRLQRGKTVHVPRDISDSSSDNIADPRLLDVAAAALAKEPMPLGADIFIAVIAPDPELSADLTRNIHLRSFGETGRRQDAERGLHVSSKSSGWAAVTYDVRPGAHTLSFENFERRMVEQQVFAMPGRRTIVLLHYGQTSIVERQKNDSRIRKRRGIDPARTVMVSSHVAMPVSHLIRDIEVAEILIYHLRTRNKAVDPSVAVALQGGEADPFLKLYAATGVLALPGSVLQRLAVSVAQEIGAVPDDDDAALSLFRELSSYRDWSDVTCLGWRLQPPNQDRSLTLSSIPMLEICWRWASAYSVRARSQDVIEPALSLAAARSDPSATPWLVIGTPSETLDTNSPESFAEIEPELSALAGTVSHILKALTLGATSSRRSGVKQSPFLDLSALSPSTDRVVRAIMGTGGIERWGAADVNLLPQLAASMGEPIAVLGATIKSAVDEVGALLEQDLLEQNSVWTSDPNKGKFGGSPHAHGITLSLKSATETKGLEYMALELEVLELDSSARIEGPVTFHLHPTFSPSVELVRISEGRASFTCYASGASPSELKHRTDVGWNSISPKTNHCRSGFARADLQPGSRPLH